jgi:putative phage-type endonuclease
VIDASRFLVRSVEREAWLEASRGGVSATEVANAATPSGFAQVAEQRRNPVPIEDNSFMQFGREAEPEIMRYAHHEFGLLSQDWLIADETDRRFFATPDGISVHHTEIAEVKTTGDPWDGAETNVKKLPIKYRRQVQWQLMCTGAERCLFLWMLREPDTQGYFYMPWLSPRWVWIEPDPLMISELVATANRLLSLDGDF